MYSAPLEFRGQPNKRCDYGGCDSNPKCINDLRVNIVGCDFDYSDTR